MSSQSAHMAHTTSGRVGPWPNGGVHVGPQHPLQPHARQEVSLGGRAVSCEAAKLVGPFTRPHFLSIGTSLETENLGLRAVVDFGPQEAVPLLGTCMHVSMRTHTDTHTRTHTRTHTHTLSLSHPAGTKDGGHWCSGSELLHMLLKPHADVGVQWQGILEQATLVGQPLCAPASLCRAR